MDYVNELELKSLILRIKKSRVDHNTVKTGKTIYDNSISNVKENRKLKKYLTWHYMLKMIKPTADEIRKRKISKVMTDLKDKIISKSLVTPIDKASYEYFGECINEMINRILTKSQFRNYSYHDEFISDSIYKILKYLDNFDHTKISVITNQPINAFAYISQIIHNSILYIINTNKKYNEFIQREVMYERIKLGTRQIIDMSKKSENCSTVEKMFSVSTDSFNENLNEIKEYVSDKNCKDDKITVFYSDDLDLNELYELYELKKLNKKVEITMI